MENYLETTLTNSGISIAEWLRLEDHETEEQIIENALQLFTKDITEKIDDFIS